MNLSHTFREQRYSWDDTVTFRHSNGESFPVPLSSIKNTDYVGYVCSSCKSPTTLADGNCGSCGNPFEPLDIREAKQLFPSVQVRETNPDRVAFLILHRAWICTTCNSYNVNYPRTGGMESIGCVNCGNHYNQSKDILLDDGDILTEGEGDTVANFRNKILVIIEQRKPKKVRQSLGGNTGGNSAVLHSAPSQSGGNQPYTGADRGEQRDDFLSRNKWKILIGTLSVGFMYTIYYGFIEEISVEIQITGHKWERVMNIEGYRQKNGSGWEKDINPNSYAEFRVMNRSMKEAPWTGRDIQVGTRTVTDYGNCITTHKSCTSSKTTTSTGVTVDGPKSCTESCIKHGTKPEPIMKTIYEIRPYLDYTYMDWVVVGSPKSTGMDKKPHWPDMSSYNLDNRNLRLGTKNENYTIKVIPEQGKSEILSVPFDTWNKLSQGDKCLANTTRWGGLLSRSIIDRTAECLRQ